MVEWNIRPRGHVCSICEKKFEDKQPCVSVLRETETGGYEGMDCCAPCWKGMTRDWTPFSVWEGEYEAPPPPQQKAEPVKKDTAESLLRRLVLLDDPAMRNVIYVLAVMLERAKQLVERDAKPREDGTILRVYEHRKSGDSFLVIDPRLRLDRLGDVQQQVIELLSGTHTLTSENATPPAPDGENAAPAPESAENGATAIPEA